MNMTLHKPFEIGARLLPALRIGQSFVSLEYDRTTKDGRAAFRYYIDTPDFEHSEADLKSGVGGCDLQEAFASLLSFLSACGEAYAYNMRTHCESENADLFPTKVGDWAYQHKDEIDMLRLELEETPDLITE